MSDTTIVEPAAIGSALRISFGAGASAAELDEATRRILKICNDLGSKKVD